MSLYLGIYYIAKQEKTPKIPRVSHVKRNMSFRWLVNYLYIILLFGSLPRVALLSYHLSDELSMWATDFW